MLARLQQALVLVWLTAWLAGSAWAGAQGRGGLALGITAGALTGHAAWLAVSCALAAWQNWRDPQGRASARQWLRAWWGEVRAAPRVFAWQQPFRSRTEADFVPQGARGQAGVVLVHGFVCNRGLWNPWMRDFRRRGLPVVAVNLEPVFGSIDEYTGVIEAAVQRLEAATGVPPLLVGHSMGGLAIRSWLRASQGDQRVRGVVTIGTPHQGTWLAQGAVVRNGRQMRPDSDWLQALAASEPASRRQRFLCIFSHTDNIVFPAQRAVLPGARRCHVPATAHLDLLHGPGVMPAVLAQLGVVDVATPVAPGRARSP
jgi:triacylglycerol lipase